MKTRFSTYDLMCSITELQRLIGMRVAQVYDIDHKTYLIKLQRTEEKCVLLLESGSRMHTTAFEWPKNVAPSGFSMKMRKHLRNKRLESMKQLGIDRVVDLQFGSGEAAYHIILELYDRGNIILTDCELTILNVLRPHTEGEEVRFAVREKYPLDRAHQRKILSQEEVETLLALAKPGDNIKNILNRNTEYGPAILEHILLGAGFTGNCKLGKSFNVLQDIPRLLEAFQQAEMLFDIAQQKPSKGYIVQKRDRRPLPDGGEEDFFSSHEFHPMVFQQHTNCPLREFESFDAAIDEFFSTLESQKIDMKALQQEKEAMKKLENVRKDHSQRLVALEHVQEKDRRRAELITMNQQLVDRVVLAVRAMIASQASWSDIEEMVKEAQVQGDPVACSIHELKLAVNHVALKLSDPYLESSEDEDEDDRSEDKVKSLIIDIDLDLTAFANARKYYDQKRNAAKKQQKTIDAQTKAFKSAEKKTKQTLKEVQAITHINKARKVFWFEKFHWFISSENYLVIGGRDPQQNELIVKRYLRAGDVYVHADIQGASSIVIKNPSGQPVPPKTLNEAGVMAMSYSVAWDAKVVTSAWWVYHDQVSKTAPTGEYLTTGAFMIRGKKNYLPPSHLIMGFSFLFKLEDGSIERHRDERKVRTLEEDSVSSVGSTLDNMSLTEHEQDQDQEIELEDSDEVGEDEGSGGDEEKLNEESTTLLENKNQDRFNSPDSSRDFPEGSKEHFPVKDDNQPDETVSNDSADEDGEQAVKEKQVEFPDIELKIQHTGTTVKLEVPTSPLLLTKEEPDSDQVIFLGDDKPVLLKNYAISRNQQGKNRGPGKKQDKEKSKTLQQENEMNERNEGMQQQQQQPQQLKRGQKGKLKKMKEKYKDQDEEDKKLMMEILKSDGTSKESKDKGKKKGKEQHSKVQGQKQLVERKPRPVKPPKVSAGGEAGEDSDGGEEERVPAAEVDMLDSLTGQPIVEDELLFAVPVVAPYSTLHNYKFKVKLTPGTGKRGKAAKTAMNMFLKDRSTTPHEKDLIKSVKDEDLARNLPGKVKVSAPQLQKLKR